MIKCIINCDPFLKSPGAFSLLQYGLNASPALALARWRQSQPRCGEQPEQLQHKR